MLAIVLSDEPLRVSVKSDVFDLIWRRWSVREGKGGSYLWLLPAPRKRLIGRCQPACVPDDLLCPVAKPFARPLKSGWV